MTLVVGWRPFPWTCIKCSSQEIVIIPTNNPKDLQEIQVTCSDCGAEWFTSGSPICIDKDAEEDGKGTWRDCTQEELDRIKQRVK